MSKKRKTSALDLETKVAIVNDNEQVKKSLLSVPHKTVIYMTCAPIVLVVVMIREINSKDEQGNDSIIATRRSQQHHSN